MRKNNLHTLFISFFTLITLSTAISAKEGYLIITDSQYSTNSSLLKFITFREKLFDVTVKTISEAGNSSSAIKSLIKDMYDSNNLRYVLFIGKGGTIPYETVNQNPTYQKYGDFNETGYMDVAIGCFFVRSASDLDNIIYKTIYTENNVSNYPKKQIQYSTFADDQHIFNQCGVIRDNYWESPSSTDLTYQTSWMIPNPSMGEGSSEYNNDLKDAVNSNDATFIAYQGHGGETGWVGGMSNSDVMSLTNDEVYPIILSNACVTGSFQNYSKCFGEAWTTYENGAVAFYGASMNSYSYQKNFNAGWACGVAMHPEITRIGDLFAYAKAFVRDSTVHTSVSGFDGDPIRETMYNLFGDPALEFRETPTAITNKLAKSNAISTMNIASVTRSSMTISLKEFGDYSISILTANGRLVNKISAKNLSAGINTVNWNGANISNGVYLVSISGMGQKANSKVILD